MKKCTKWIIKIIIVVSILWLIAFGIDYYRCLHLKEPIFVLTRWECLVLHSNGRRDFGCYCLGYRVDYSTISTSEGKEQVTWIAMFIFNKCIVEEQL